MRNPAAENNKKKLFTYEKLKQGRITQLLHINTYLNFMIFN